MYRITIEQEQQEVGVITGDVTGASKWVEIYRQSPTEIDLVKIISAVNSRPRKPRTPAKKEQAK